MDELVQKEASFQYLSVEAHLYIKLASYQHRNPYYNKKMV